MKNSNELNSIYSSNPTSNSYNLPSSNLKRKYLKKCKNKNFVFLRKIQKILKNNFDEQYLTLNLNQDLSIKEIDTKNYKQVQAGIGLISVLNIFENKQIIDLNKFNFNYNNLIVKYGLINQATQTQTPDFNVKIDQSSELIEIINNLTEFLDKLDENEWILEENKEEEDSSNQLNLNNNTIYFNHVNQLNNSKRNVCIQKTIVKSTIGTQTLVSIVHFKIYQTFLLLNELNKNNQVCLQESVIRSKLVKTDLNHLKENDFNNLSLKQTKVIQFNEHMMDNDLILLKSESTSKDEQNLKDYLKNLLLEIQSSQKTTRKIKQRNVCVQTMNDWTTDESHEYAARCPLLRKKELIYSSSLFNKIDKLSIEAPCFNELKELVNYLTENCENDFFKIRAIFRWITVNLEFSWTYIESEEKILLKLPKQSVQKEQFNQKDSSSSVFINEDSNEYDYEDYLEKIFKEHKGSSKEFCHLFSEMCKLCGIRCKIIQGFAKNYDYRPGHKYLVQDVNNIHNLHYWMGVFVLGNWHLIDITWATGYTDPVGKFVRKLNEFYFFTDPEHLVWTHFPIHNIEHDYERWQLLDKPLTLIEFNNLPKITLKFFEYNLRIRSKLANPIMFNVQTEIKLSAHEPIRYKFKLFAVDEIENCSLNHYVFCQLKEERLVASIIVCPPIEGHFYLKLYAKSEREMQDQNPDNASLHYVCTMLLDCTKARKYQNPYPLNELPWGPAQAFYNYKMRLINQNSAIISTWGGKRKLMIQCNEPMLLTHQIIDADGQEMDTRTIINRDDENSTNLITLNILPPKIGMFKLMIFGMPKPKQKGKWRLPLLATFLIDCRLAKLPPANEDPPPLPMNLAEDLGKKLN